MASLSEPSGTPGIRAPIPFAHAAPHRRPRARFYWPLISFEVRNTPGEIEGSNSSSHDDTWNYSTTNLHGIGTWSRISWFADQVVATSNKLHACIMSSSRSLNTSVERNSRGRTYPGVAPGSLGLAKLHPRLRKFAALRLPIGQHQFVQRVKCIANTARGIRSETRALNFLRWLAYTPRERSEGKTLKALIAAFVRC